MSLVFRDAHKTSLRIASPATVSRAEMIYIDATELGWRTDTESWVTAKFRNDEESKAKFSIAISSKSDYYRSCSSSKKCTATSRISKGCPDLCADYNNSITEKTLIFALTWSVAKRFVPHKLLSYLISIDTVIPAANTVLDSFVDMSKNDLIGWDAKVPSWRAVQSMTFHDMIGIPLSIVDALLKIKRNVSLVGATGTGMEDCV
eukprot:gene41605-56305_t